MPTLARRLLFSRDLVGLVAVDPSAVMVGDWNCITRKEDEKFSPPVLKEDLP